MKYIRKTDGCGYTVSSTPSDTDKRIRDVTIRKDDGRIVKTRIVAMRTIPAPQKPEQQLAAEAAG